MVREKLEFVQEDGDKMGAATVIGKDKVIKEFKHIAKNSYMH